MREVMEELKLIVELLLLVIGGFIIGASYVGIQLEKVKKQRDEALERLEEYE